MKLSLFLGVILSAGCAIAPATREQALLVGVFIDRGFDSGQMLHLRSDHSYTQEQYGMGADTTPIPGTWFASKGRVTLVSARGKLDALQVRPTPDGPRLEGDEGNFVFWMNSASYDAMQLELKDLKARFSSNAINRGDYDRALYAIVSRHDRFLNKPNKKREPTTTAVTPPASQEPRQP